MPFSSFTEESSCERTQAFNMAMPDATLPNIDSVQPETGTAALTVNRGDCSCERFILDIPEVTLGRDPKCDIFLNDRTVSRRHAHLSIHAGEAYIEDLCSLNGTWVNGAIVAGCQLHDGDTIQIGAFKLTFTLG